MASFTHVQLVESSKLLAWKKDEVKMENGATHKHNYLINISKIINNYTLNFPINRYHFW